VTAVMDAGFGKIQDCARYAGISVRTFRKWLRMGLSYSKMPTGAILIKFKNIDEFIEKFRIDRNEVDRLVDEVMREL